MNVTPLLETECLNLRAPKPSDLDVYLAFYAVSDATIGGYRGGRDDIDVAAILNRDIRHWQTHGFGIFLLWTKAGGAFAGGTGLCLPEGWPSSELTWWLMPETRGTGYATEASRAVIAWAYGTLGWAIVETWMRDENAAARRLAQRLGGNMARRETFPDGITRDVFAFPENAPA